MDSLISRQMAIDKFEPWLKVEGYSEGELNMLKAVLYELRFLPSVQSEIIRCRDCKYFELDHFEKVDGFPIPIIVAHEICMKWGEGCRSSIDGWCFMAERRTDE